MNPFGVCGHTHYEGGPACVHTAYDMGYAAGLDKSISIVNGYIDDTVQHIPNALGLCDSDSGDRCDVTSGLSAARNRISSVAYDFERSGSISQREHDPLCPSRYTFTACECALIQEVRMDEAVKSQNADIVANVSEG